MTETLSLICMKYYLISLFIHKRRITWYQIIFYLHSKHISFLFVPHKNTYLFNIFICFSEIMFEKSFASSLIKVAFWIFLLNFCDICPSFTVIVMLCFAKYIILKYLLMLLFGCYRLKRSRFFNPSFI